MRATRPSSSSVWLSSPEVLRRRLDVAVEPRARTRSIARLATTHNGDPGDDLVVGRAGACYHSRSR